MGLRHSQGVCPGAAPSTRRPTGIPPKRGRPVAVWNTGEPAARNERQVNATGHPPDGAPRRLHRTRTARCSNRAFGVTIPSSDPVATSQRLGSALLARRSVRAAAHHPSDIETATSSVHARRRFQARNRRTRTAARAASRSRRPRRTKMRRAVGRTAEAALAHRTPKSSGRTHRGTDTRGHRFRGQRSFPPPRSWEVRFPTLGTEAPAEPGRPCLGGDEKRGWRLPLRSGDRRAVQPKDPKVRG